MYKTNILQEVRYLIPQTISERRIRGVQNPVFCFPAGILGKPSKLMLNRDGDIGALPAGYSRLSQDAPVSLSLLSAKVLMGRVNRQAITKRFKSAGSITAGQVVVIDSTQDGYITTIIGGTKIIGVAVQTVTGAGDDIEMGVGGAARANATNTLASTNGSVSGKVTCLQNVGSLAWIMIPLGKTQQ